MHVKQSFCDIMSVFCIQLFFIIPTNSESYQWCPVTSNDIISKHELAVRSTYSTGNLVIDATITNSGCGGQESHIFVYISDTVDGSNSNQWIKVKYTMEFWGSSSCWSLLGNTHYGDFDDNFDTGLYYNQFKIISNQLLHGTWNGANITCDNERSNFWHSINGREGYKGSITVEQTRNIDAYQAGIGSGHSCTIPQITKIRFSDIKVAYYDSDIELENLECAAQADDSSNVTGNQAVVWGIVVGVCVCCLFACTMIIFANKCNSSAANVTGTEVANVDGKAKTLEKDICAKEMVSIKPTVSASAPIEADNDLSKHGDNLCIFCCTNDANMCCNPCGHVFVCNKCYGVKKEELKQCPQCRKEIINCIKLFKAGFQT